MDEHTLLVVSSDLSHYHPYEEANRLDSQTRAQIESQDPSIRPEQACGAHAINGLLYWAKAHQGRVHCVAACNSGDGPASKDQVVGYASFTVEL